MANIYKFRVHVSYCKVIMRKKCTNIIMYVLVYKYKHMTTMTEIDNMVQNNILVYLHARIQYSTFL